MFFCELLRFEWCCNDLLLTKNIFGRFSVFIDEGKACKEIVRCCWYHYTRFYGRVFFLSFNHFSCCCSKYLSAQILFLNPYSVRSVFATMVRSIRFFGCKKFSLSCGLNITQNNIILFCFFVNCSDLSDAVMICCWLKTSLGVFPSSLMKGRLVKKL